MKRMLTALATVLLLALTSCGTRSSNGDGNDDAPDFSVTISPTSASVRTGDTQAFTATVLNPNNTGVTWGLYGAGCEAASCGTIVAGLYTAPSAVPNPATVQITATSKDDTNKSAGATVTILPGVAVSVSPLTADVAVRSSKQFTALVQNSTNTSVTWTVAGAGCTGATCGTIATDGLYTAPATVPTPPTVTITATSQADTRRSGTATVTIGGSSVGRLNGHFAFLLSGFDADGAMHTAGSFVADGDGHVTNGVQDINNRTGGVSAQVAFTGTYTLGADNRGELVLTNALGISRFRFALNADASEARMIQFDDTGTRTSGVFMRQEPVDFSTSTFVGDYVLSFSGAGRDGRIAAIGRFHADGAGHFSDGMLDINDGTATPPATTTWNGAYSVSSGRGTAAINVAGIGVINFNFYFGYTNHSHISEPPAMFFVSMDPPSAGTPLLSGQVYQAFPFDLGNYSDATWSPESGLKIFALAGKVAEGGATAIAGSFEGDGAGHLQNGLFDQNRAGAISSSSNFGATYTIASSGRGTATLQLSATQTLPITFYLATDSRAVVLGTPGFDVLLGSVWPVGPGGAPGLNTVFSGDYISGPFALPAPDMMMFSGCLSSDGAGHFSGTQDINDVAGQSAEQPIAGIYAFGVRARAAASLSGGGETVIYMISLDSHLAISVDPSDTRPVVLVIKR